MSIKDTSEGRDKASCTNAAYLDKSGKQAGRLAATMQLIRKREEAKRFDETKAVDVQHHELSRLFDDLRDVIDDIGEDGRYFNFHLLNGEVPQLRIDQSTFVVMAKGGEGFRLLKETRAGRVMLRESRGREAMGEAVVHYIAERLSQIENQRGQAQPIASSYENNQDIRKNRLSEEQVIKPEPIVIARTSRLRSFVWFLIGFLTGAITLLVLAWFRTEISVYLSTV